jgi:ATP-dependent RNA helicase DeaD
MSEDAGPDSPPGSTVEPEDSLPEMTLADLPPESQAAAARLGWTSLMPVQAKAIPYLRAGRDLMVQSRTGSGKTGAFLLPILERVDSRRAACQALVLVPTRELAHQVNGEAEKMAAGSRVRVVPVYGGVGYGAQLEALKQGAHVVIGTPGRILDHLERGTLKLESLRILVFDEADRMLSMGFYPDMIELRSYLPPERNGFMFSATYPRAVLTLAKQFLDEPEFLSLSHGEEHVASTEHLYYEVPSMEKDRALVRIIEIENPDSAIVFCNTKANVRYVAIVLQRFGYDAEQLSADLAQKEREQVLERTYKKQLRFLVSTDLAGRGIDIESLSHVILYDFPEDPESYVHRTGRTGRAGASGEAISLVDRLEKLALKDVARRFGIDFVRKDLPTEEEVQNVVGQRVTALLEQKLRHLDKLVAERMQRMLPLARGLGESDEERAIIAMLLDEYYQESLHAPPLPPAAEKEEAKPSGEGRGRRRRGRRGGRR